MFSSHPSQERKPFLYGVAGFILALMFFTILLVFGYVRPLAPYPDPQFYQMLSDYQNQGMTPPMFDARYDGTIVNRLVTCEARLQKIKTL